MKATVFMQDVAKATGFHRTTVSLALRNDPRIAAETRAQVQAVAERLGYRVDPFVAALMQAKRMGHTTPKHVSLAYVTAHPGRFDWRDKDFTPNFFPAAAAQAARYGYKLEHFWLKEPGMSPSRFSNILSARNVRGLIIAPPPPDLDHIELNWERFSAVIIGVGLREPPLHRVSVNHFETAKLALRECARRGFKRIALCLPLPTTGYLSVNEKWLGAYQVANYEFPQLELLPPHFIAAPSAADFLRWFKRSAPEIIIAIGDYGDLTREWLRKNGVRIPEDVSLASFPLKDPQGWMGGVYSDNGLTGAAAVDLLTGMIYRNETGIPNHAHDLMIRSHWWDGQSIRKSTG